MNQKIECECVSERESVCKILGKLKIHGKFKFRTLDSSRLDSWWLGGVPSRYDMVSLQDMTGNNVC